MSACRCILGWAVAVAVVAAPASSSADFRLPVDEDPPRVTIVSPMQGERLVAGPELMFVRVEATDDESGVADVWLQIDGEVMEQLHDDDRPYAIPIDLPVGPHRVRAYADDYEGRVGDSEPVMFEIVAPDSTDDDDGVVERGCASDPRGRRAAWLWSLVFAARRRRLGDPS